MREVQRKMQGAGFSIDQPKAVSDLSIWLERAERIRTQQRADKNKNKLYALHAPEVESRCQISAGKASNAGRTRSAMRLMIALTLLKKSFDLSDEELVQRFAENVYWQHVAGFEYLQAPPTLRCHPDWTVSRHLGRSRPERTAQRHHPHRGGGRCHQQKRVQARHRGHHGPGKSHCPPAGQPPAGDGPAQSGGGGQTPRYCVEANLRWRWQDTATPGGRLRPRQAVQASAPRGQTPAHDSWHPHSRDQAQDGEHPPDNALAFNALNTWLECAERVRTQQRKDKNKLYALHAPEVECIGKGKARKSYEFGVRVSVAVTHK
jgi:transposase, IS5 family